jgi:hypothetical protein
LCVLRTHNHKIHTKITSFRLRNLARELHSACANQGWIGYD